MANCVREIDYRCSDDCRMEGCPGHKGILNYQSVSDAYSFSMNGRILHFERGELEAMIALLQSLSDERADAIQFTRPAPSEGDVEAGVPEGWVFQTADFSMVTAGTGKGAVSLRRAKPGFDAWMALSEEDRNANTLYVFGFGSTLAEAFRDGARQAAELPPLPQPAKEKGRE